jgi:ribosomal protein S18 acetylase RimI-like enzyme
MKIRKLRLVEVDQVAKLHQTYIGRGFLSTLGSNFLARLYGSMLASENTFCIVACDGPHIAGFVSGSKHVAVFYKQFILSNFISVGVILLPKIFSLTTVKKIVETLLYPLKKKLDLPDAELLSIVVDEPYRGQGVSRELFHALVYEFASRSINHFKIVVGDHLTAACRFYEQMGCVLHSELEVHVGEKSRIYVWGIR